MIDQFGQIVFSTNGKESGKKLTESFLTELKNNTGRMFEWTIDNQPTYIVQSGSTYSGWTVIAYIGAKEAFSELDKMGNSTMIIVIFGIFAALLFSTFLSWTISRPIRLLAKRLSRLNKGVLMPYQGKTSNKEVAILHESFNQMVEHLNQTIKDLSDKQISERQAQLVALKAQIRPHFLYNSLNTIYWSLINDDRAKEAQMVLTLSDLMRYSIQPGSEMVTVSEDVKQLQRFIEISKLRYGDKLQTEVEVDDDALELKMMKLLLQPIVENAITHGLEPVKGPWLIRIRIFRKDQLIHFVVEDNGIGMMKAQMLKVLEFHHDAEKETIMHSGIGLANLNYRVGIIYGKEYGLKLSMSELGGLKVEVSLPLALEDNREQSPDRFEKGDVK